MIGGGGGKHAERQAAGSRVRKEGAKGGIVGIGGGRCERMLLNGRGGSAKVEVALAVRIAHEHFDDALVERRRRLLAR